MPPVLTRSFPQAERFDALAQLRERLNTLWMVLPLLSKLRERAIRPRHWVIVLKLTEGQTISKLDLSPVCAIAI